MDHGLVTEGEQHAGNGLHQDVVISARQVGPANPAGKQRVAHEQVVSPFPLAPFPLFQNLQADSAWAVTRGVVDAHLVIAEINGRHVVEHINGRLGPDLEPEHRALLDDVLVERKVVAVQIHRRVEGEPRRIDAAHVIEVGVREQDVLDLHVAIANGPKDLVDLVPRVDDNRLFRALTADDKAVFVERGDRSDFENHLSGNCTPNVQSMVLCVVDDLLFSVKISTAAKSLGVDIYFERAAEHVLARIREKQPHLVIFDLNSSKLRPMDAIAEMKADPALKDVRTLGYVSHVQTDTINAARQAGVDQVLARSAFAERLGEILTSGGSESDS